MKIKRIDKQFPDHIEYFPEDEFETIFRRLGSHLGEPQQKIEEVIKSGKTVETCFAYYSLDES